MVGLEFKEIMTGIVTIIVAIIGSPLVVAWYNKRNNIKKRIRRVNNRISNDKIILDKLYELLYKTCADRAFIYQLHPESNPMYISCTYEVVKTGVSKEIQNLQGLPISEWNEFLFTMRKNGFIFIKNVDELKEKDIRLKILLKNKGVISAYKKAMFDKHGVLKGFIGIDIQSVHAKVNDEHCISESVQQLIAEQAIFLEKYIGEENKNV